MVNFLITYWLAALPVALTGVLMLGMLKKMRDTKAEKEKTLVPIAVRRKQQG